MKFQALLALFFSSMIKNGAMTCKTPPQQIENVKGEEGEIILTLANSRGKWSVTARDVETEKELSKYFKMVATGTSSKKNWDLRIIKSVNLKPKYLHTIDLTLRCTLTDEIKMFYRQFLLRKHDDSIEEKVCKVLEIYIKGDTRPGTVVYELSKDLGNATGDVYEVMERGEFNTETAAFFEVTKNGVITLSKTLKSHVDEMLLLLLRRMKINGKSEIVPIVTNVRRQPIIAPNNPLLPPSFMLENCHFSDCKVSTYRVKIDVDHKGEIDNIEPSQIYAEDPNGGPVSYYITSGNPVSAILFFSMERTTGAVNTHDLELIDEAKDFYLIIQAWDDPPSDYFNTALLHITVECEEELLEVLESEEMLMVYDDLGIAGEIKASSKDLILSPVINKETSVVSQNVSGALPIPSNIGITKPLTNSAITTEPVKIPEEPHWLYDDKVAEWNEDTKAPEEEMMRITSNSPCTKGGTTLVIALQTFRLFRLFPSRLWK